MHIDNSRKYTLTNYASVKCGGQAKDSDHFTQYLDLNLKVESEKPKRIEMYDFKDKEGRKKFKILTSETQQFTDCFENMQSLSEQVEKWRTTLETYCKRSFRKIRIRKNKIKPFQPKLAKLINLRNILMKNVSEPTVKTKIDALNEIISNEEAEENRAKIVENFGKLSEDPENINLQNMWKMMKKLWPKEGITI